MAAHLRPDERLAERRPVSAPPHRPLPDLVHAADSTVPLIALVQAWGLVPLIALILLGGLQGIPSELYEAAQIDGASSYKSFRYITLPLLQPSIAAALAIGTVVSFGIFDAIYVLVGADRDARSVMMQVYLTTFSNLDFGHGAALAVLISIVSLFMWGAYMLFLRKTGTMRGIQGGVQLPQLLTLTVCDALDSQPDLRWYRSPASRRRRA